MDFVLIGIVAFGASMLTFFSGFGLGTLLLPAFGLFFPLEWAIAMTAVVHFLNNIFKIGLIGVRQIPPFGGSAAVQRVVWSFGIPSVFGALVGAFLLQRMGKMDNLATYQAFGKSFSVVPLKVCIGFLLIFFALFELIPSLRDRRFSEKYMPIGGILSGFFGGLAGFQGALRSAFLVRADLSKTEFIATGITIACLVDLSRLSRYVSYAQTIGENWILVGVATICAFAGAWVGNRFLKKITIQMVQKLVAAFLLIFGFLSILGIV